MSNYNNNYGNQYFLQHIQNYVGQTVTVFTTSGGASGCGFTGVLLSVNCDYLRISTHLGNAPSNPLSESICGDFVNNGENGYNPAENQGYPDGNNGYNPSCNKRNHGNHNTVGSVVDIPFNRIAAFCHNAI